MTRILAGNARFTRFWADAAVARHAEDQKTIRHPHVGDITVDCDVLTDGDTAVDCDVLTDGDTDLKVTDAAPPVRPVTPKVPVPATVSMVPSTTRRIRLFTVSAR